MSNQEISKQFDKLDAHFLRESQKNLPEDSRIQDFKDMTPQPTITHLLPDTSKLPIVTEDAEGFNRLKEEHRRGKKHETSSKWNTFQPYAYKKLSDRDKEYQFLELFDDYQEVKKRFNEEKERSRLLEADIVKLRRKKSRSPNKGDNLSKDYTETRELKN